MIPDHRFPKFTLDICVHVLTAVGCTAVSIIFCCFESLQKSLTLFDRLKYEPSQARYDTAGNLAVKAAVKMAMCGLLTLRQ